MPMRLPLRFASTPAPELIPIGQILDAHIKTLDVMKEVDFESNPRTADGEVLVDQFYVTLQVWGEEDEFIEVLGLPWDFPNHIDDTPERSQIWAGLCVEVMKSIVVNSKPRDAIRDATLMMENAILNIRRFDLCFVDALRRGQ